MKLIKGNDMGPVARKQALAAFIYRLTVENGYPQRNPCNATVAPITDAEWIAQHAFYVKKNGELANVSYCEPAYMAN